MASVATTPDSHIHVDEHAQSSAHDYATALRHNRFGLWLFFLSEIFLFGGLLVARFYLWVGPEGITRPELSQTIGLIVTVALLISSFSINLGEKGMEHGDRRTFLWGFGTTFVLGIVFLLGVMVFEWGIFPFVFDLFPFLPPAHITPSDGVFGAVLFAMTGMHAIHVVTGLIFIAIVWNLGRKGEYSPDRHWGVESCAIYWHYVDVVWIFFYPALYLIGTVAEAAH